jgi:peptidoglycan-binding protein ArfA
VRAPFLIVAALLLALTGCGGADRTATTTSAASSSTTPVTTTTTESGAPFGAMSIVRTGDGFDLSGELPDEATRGLLPESIRQAMPGARIVDHLTVRPGVKAPEFAGLGALFGAALDIPGFAAKLVGDTVTLTGTAGSEELKAAAASAAETTWPKARVVNRIEVKPT